MGRKVVVALGGNAISKPGETPSFENQLENVKKSANLMADIVENGYTLIITHGNGPQVGAILRQNEEARAVTPSMPLTVCGAQSQGFIGYMIEQCLKNALAERGLDARVVTLLTEVEVDKGDEAFKNPAKPIGIFYSHEEAEALTREKGWVMAEDSGRGYRRVVPSPVPVNIHGVDVIKTLADNGVIVISAGGGGIPVVKNSRGLYEGVDAVIDKDRSALRLSEQVGADTFMILTDVSGVYINYGKPGQIKLDTLSSSDAEKYLKEGQFGTGSMGPKVESALKFAKSGKEAIICALEDAAEALRGERGTRIVR